MASVLLGLQIILAAVLVVAATAKILSSDQFRAALLLSHLPDRLVPTLTYAVPVVELALALGLVLTRSAALEAFLIAVGALFLAFASWMTWVIVRRLPAHCACFGSRGGEVRWSGVGRNLALIATAGAAFVVAARTDAPLTHPSLALAVVATAAVALVMLGMALLRTRRGMVLTRAQLLRTFLESERSGFVTSFIAFSGLFYASYVMLWVLLVGIALLVVLLYRHLGLVTMGTLEGVQRDGLAIGEVAPELTGVGADGSTVAWKPAEQRPTLLLFAAPGCKPCEEVLPFVECLVARPHEAALDVATVVQGPRNSVVALAEKRNPRLFAFADDGSGGFERYRVRVTPFAFVIGEDGRVRSKGLCSDGVRLRDLLHTGGADRAALAVESAVEESAREAGGNGRAVHLQEVNS